MRRAALRILLPCLLGTAGVASASGASPHVPCTISESIVASPLTWLGSSILYESPGGWSLRNASGNTELLTAARLPVAIDPRGSWILLPFPTSPEQFEQAVRTLGHDGEIAELLSRDCWGFSATAVNLRTGEQVPLGGGVGRLTALAASEGGVAVMGATGAIVYEWGDWTNGTRVEPRLLRVRPATEGAIVPPRAFDAAVAALSPDATTLALAHAGESKVTIHGGPMGWKGLAQETIHFGNAVEILAISFSPDGTRLAVASSVDGGSEETEVAVVSAQGGILASRMLGRITGLAWSAPGIVAVEDDATTGRLLLLDADGALAERQRLDIGLPTDRGVAVSPRGTDAAVRVVLPGGGIGVAVVDLESGKLEVLSPTADSVPRFQAPSPSSLQPASIHDGTDLQNDVGGRRMDVPGVAYVAGPASVLAALAFRRRP